jgi:hypothetical protein
MKPNTFFIGKAESFITELNLMKLVEINYEEFTNNIDQKRITGNKSNFDIQRTELYDLKFHIKLMFSEFDNGNSFLQKLEDFNNINPFSNEPLKNHLLKTTQLFLDFLNEYRV